MKGDYLLPEMIPYIAETVKRMERLLVEHGDRQTDMLLHDNIVDTFNCERSHCTACQLFEYRGVNVCRGVKLVTGAPDLLSYHIESRKLIDLLQEILDDRRYTDRHDGDVEKG